MSDERSAPLPHAWVRASTGGATLTDSRGAFRLTGLPAGPCTLTVALVGYRPARTPLRFESRDETLALEIVLTPIAIPVGEISVQASPAPRDGAVLSQEQLARIPGTGDDVMRAVQTLPGLAAPEASASFLLRGGESDETLVRYDGIDLLEAYHVREWGGSFSIVSLETTERIRLLRGGLPARYGRHLSGVLEVEGPERPPDRTTLDVGIGFSQVRAAALIPAAGGSILVAAREGVFAAVARSVEFDPDANVIPEFHDLLVSGRRPLGEHGWLNVMALGVVDDVFYDETYPGNDIRSHVKNFVGGARWTTRPPSGARHEAVLSADYFDRLEQLGRTGAGDARTRALRGRWITLIPVGTAMSVEAGILAEYEESFLRFDTIDDRIVNGAYREQIVTRLVGRAARRRAEFSLAWDARWGERISTSAGVNASRDAYGWGVRRDGAPPPAWGGAAHLSPRFSVAAALSRSMTIRTSFGILRQPTFLNLLDESRAEAPLGRERSAKEATAGVELRPGNMLLRVEGYLRRDLGVGFPVQDLNSHPEIGAPLDRGDSRGLELFARSPSWRRSDASLSYAWSRATWRAPGGDVSRSFDQPHALTASLNVRPHRAWNLNATLRYHTGNAYTRGIWTTPDGGYFWDLGYGPLMGERFPRYTRLDMRISHQFSWGERATLYVEVLNVTNRVNPYVRSWRFESASGGRQTPEYFYVDLIPFLPFAGLEVRF
ncbi:MAG: carboxypeptidase regulatory-like domain-containing protein [Candidatus Eisenbacteria bacterium]